MITSDYIGSFKESNTYKVICSGMLKNDIKEVLLGESPYRITSRFENANTEPSQVMIGMHILLLDKKISSDIINKTIISIDVTKDTICLLLDYIDTYLIYKKDHDELKIDYRLLLEKIEAEKGKYQDLICVENFLRSIYDSINSNELEN